MRKNAFVKEGGTYLGQADSKMPALTTPPPAMDVVSKAMAADTTPSPIGVQTATCPYFTKHK